jgi:hypothetical protein
VPVGSSMPPWERAAREDSLVNDGLDAVDVQGAGENQTAEAGSDDRDAWGG